MSFAAEYRVDPEDQTQCAGSSSVDEDSHSTIEHLVAIRQKRQLVMVFRPREKNITFGRSSHCSITLPDPRFSRKAGEIVLGPVPILRRYRDGEENSEFIPIHPGKPYRFRPYTITLMESGDVIFNRYRKNNGSKAGLLKTVLFIIAALGAGSIFLFHQGMTDATDVNPEQGSASFSVVSEQTRDEITEKPEIKENAGDMENLRLASIGHSTEKQVAVPENTSDNSTPTPQIKESATARIRPSTEKKNRKVTMRADELDRAIKAAALLIKQGDLKTAGRALLPLMPHLDNEQLIRMIGTLDPPVLGLFQKAYMLKLYEPGRSNEILQSIVESGLEILPSYGKAKRMLEGEQRWMSGHLRVDK